MEETDVCHSIPTFRAVQQTIPNGCPAKALPPSERLRIGLVQICLFLGNNTDPERASVGRYLPLAWLGFRSVSGKSRVAEQLQPMGMALPGQ